MSVRSRALRFLLGAKRLVGAHQSFGPGSRQPLLRLAAVASLVAAAFLSGTALAGSVRGRIAGQEKLIPDVYAEAAKYGPTPIATKALAFKDLIGQPTWIGPSTVNFKTGIPDRYFGFIAEGAYFGAVNTAAETGQIVTLPPEFAIWMMRSVRSRSLRT